MEAEAAGHGKRFACTYMVHQLWDAIVSGYGKFERPLDFKELMEMRSLSDKTEAEVEWELVHAVKDQLIISEVNETEEGEKIETYKLPDSDDFEKGDKDWYCFRCHKSGGYHAVVCQECPRIYHLYCLPDEHKPQKDPFVCPACHLTSEKPSSNVLHIDQKQLNELIGYSIQGIISRGVSVVNKADGEIWAEETQRSSKESWRIKFLVFFDELDAEKILQKAKSGMYGSLEEYRVDCETVAHNCSVFGMEDAHRWFMSIVMDDMQEMLFCHDCYRVSNEKSHPMWFCLPCTRQHEVIWAKPANRCFWPAKVLKRGDNKCAVRYFGNHDRGMVEGSNIKPWKTPMGQLKVQRSPEWNEAHAEAKKYVEMQGDSSKKTSATGGNKGTGKIPNQKNARKFTPVSNTNPEVETKKFKLFPQLGTPEVSRKIPATSTVSSNVLDGNQEVHQNVSRRGSGAAIHDQETYALGETDTVVTSSDAGRQAIFQPEMKRESNDEMSLASQNILQKFKQRQMHELEQMDKRDSLDLDEFNKRRAFERQQAQERHMFELQQFKVKQYFNKQFKRRGNCNSQ